MKQCPNCKKEIEDQFVFCPHCGAELNASSKKLSFLEKRQLKEAETKELMQKSYISLEQFENAQEYNMDYLHIEHKQKLDAALKAGITRSVVAVLIIIAALAWAFVTINIMKVSKNIQLIVIFAAFMSIFASASVLISDLYLVKILKKMKKSEFAAKKIKYGKPPTICYKGELYDLFVDGKCPECFKDMHVEEIDGKFVVVCNENRNHLYKLYFDKIKEKFFTQNERKNN